MCNVCYRMGKSSLWLLSHANASKRIKHFRLHTWQDFPSLNQLTRARAALYISNSVKGGNRIARDAYVGGYLDHFLVSNTDRRAFHNEFVLLQAMTLSPHTLAANTYMRSFLNTLAGNSPPAISTFVHHTAELYKLVVDALHGKLLAARELYRGSPFVHVEIDLWTEGFRKKSFGSVVVRLVNPASGMLEELHLCVHPLVGRHTKTLTTTSRCGCCAFWRFLVSRWRLLPRPRRTRAPTCGRPCESCQHRECPVSLTHCIMRCTTLWDGLQPCKMTTAPAKGTKTYQ